MKRKTLFIIVFSLGAILLNIFLINTLSVGFSLNNILAATPSATRSLGMTLIGEIYPAANTGSNSGYGFDGENLHIYRQPIEYHLVQENGESVKLVFANNISAASLWQYWAGRWVRVGGLRIEPGLFRVDYIQGIKPIIDPNSGSVGHPKMVNTQQVTFVGQFDSMPPIDAVPNGPGPAFAVGYIVTDLAGKARPLTVYITQGDPSDVKLAAGPILTQITDLDDKEIAFSLVPSGAWALFKGWVIDRGRPQFGGEDWGFELQSIQLITSPRYACGYPLADSSCWE